MLYKEKKTFCTSVSIIARMIPRPLYFLITPLHLSGNNLSVLFNDNDKNINLMQTKF